MRARAQPPCPTHSRPASAPSSSVTEEAPRPTPRTHAASTFRARPAGGTARRPLRAGAALRGRRLVAFRTRRAPSRGVDGDVHGSNGGERTRAPSRLSRSAVEKEALPRSWMLSARRCASVAMAALMSDACTMAPLMARGMASEPTPHPASQKVSPRAALPSSSIHLRTCPEQ